MPSDSGLAPASSEPARYPVATPSSVASGSKAYGPKQKAASSPALPWASSQSGEAEFPSIQPIPEQSNPPVVPSGSSTPRNAIDSPAQSPTTAVSVPIAATTTTTSTTTTSPPQTTTTVARPSIVLTIPLGTAARIANGENVGDVLPPVLNAQQGTELVLVNQDVRFHSYGFLSARPGETSSFLLLQVGSFSGVCTVNAGQTVTINVT